MSGRRKNANPCMVRTPEHQDHHADQSADPGTKEPRAENSQSGDESVRKPETDDVEGDETGEKLNGERSPSEEDGEKENGERSPSEEDGEKPNGEGERSPSVEDGEKENGEKENQSPDNGETKAKEYRCKYCSFTTPGLGDFKEHVDAAHPGVILNPAYLCVACNFRTTKFDSLSEHNDEAHPGEADFKYRKISEDGKTLLEQTVDVNEESPAQSAAAMSPESSPIANGPPEQIRALSINGTVIIPEANILLDTTHVSPMLRRPPNFSSVPQIAVPLNTWKYNPSLDDNATLMASFNRFPYPTHTELSWLTAASKHPEEQIKVWFTTQRLKQGITWSPEEVEEARKKMFNGSIPPTHSTFTALLTSPVSKATVHTTTTAARSGASANSASNGLKRILNASLFGPNAKRPVMAVAPNPGDKGLMAPPPLPPPLQKPTDTKRVNANEIKRTVPLMLPPPTPQKNVPNNSKLKPVASIPSIVFPESLTRRTIAPPPIFAPPFKSTILVPRTTKDNAQISLPNGVLMNSAPLIPPQIQRPAVIQSTIQQTHQNEQNGDAGATSYNGKWHEPCLQNNGHLDDAQSDFQQKANVLTQFPLLERMKGKTSEQLKVLEENFLRNSFPAHGEAEALATATRLSLQEVESWFSERRALRDNLEQALLNSMGTKRNGNVYGRTENGLKAAGHLGFTLHRVPEDSSHWSFADDLSRRWFNGKTGSGLPSSELIGPRCQDLTNGNNGRAQEAELSWFNKNMSAAQHEHFRFGPPSLDLQAGGVFGRWLDRRQDLSEESSG
ncbi:zinc fingers and homeoboxes protein 2 [Eucyclogobius newberryi]|uniref:zinc fingers and homeoboxes protein 2 n=1 Tax=Eucyclogobius newberryi TaxID=166745 RepID=UPI003B5BF0A7